MFESIVSKITNTIRAIGAATRNAPWLTAAMILALFVVL